MTLTLDSASAVLWSDRVTVSYTKPALGSDNKLKDTSGNEVASFTDQSVTNNTPASLLVSNLGQTHTGVLSPDDSSFSFAQGFTTGSHPAGYSLAYIELRLGTTRTGPNVTVTPTVKVFSGSADGTEVAALSGPASLDANTTKNYRFAASGAVTLQASTDYWVVIQGGDMDILITSSKNEDASSASGWSIRDTAASRNDASRVATFEEYPIDGFIIRMGLGGAANIDNTAPLFSSATVDSTSLVITFDENLAAAANLANGAFTVKKTPSGSPEESVTLDSSSPPSISNDTVTLTLDSSSAVVGTDTNIKVSYTQPASGSDNKLKDASDNEVANFVDRAVVNSTPGATPSLVFTPASLSVTEASTATYNVKLNIQPSANVTVNIASDDTSAVTVAPASLTFTTVNWQTDQPVTVTGVVDSDTNDETVTLSHSGSGVNSGNVTVTTNDSNSNLVPVITSLGPFPAEENQVSVTTLTASVNGAPVTTGLSWSITGGADQSHFSLADSGVLSFNNPQNFESPSDDDSDRTYGLTVQVSKDGYTKTADIEVQLTDVNEAPVINTLGPFEVDENETAVKTLQATDEDNGAVLTWSITGGADQDHFILVGSTGELSFKSAKDFEATPDDDDGDQVYHLQVQVVDNHGVKVVADLIVALQDVNEGVIDPNLPVIKPPRTFAVRENEISVGTLQATYSGTGGISWSIVGGADESHFDLDSQTGQLIFDEGKDFDKPEDGDQNNLYHVEVQVTGADDPSHVATSRILVHLMDVNEAPVINTLGPFEVNENETAVATLEATDEDAGSTLTWSMKGGADAGHFLLTKGGELTFNEAKNFEAPGDADRDGTFELSVRVDDGVHVVTADLEVHLLQQKIVGSVATGSGGGGCGRFQPINTRSSVTKYGVDKRNPLGSGGNLPGSGLHPGAGLPSPVPSSGGLLFFLGLMLLPALLVQWLRWSS